jgi:hypothetical protein
MAKDDRTLLIITPGFPKNEADTTCLPSQQLFVRALNMVDPALNIVILSYEYPFFSKTYRWHGNTVISLKKKKKGFLNKCRTALDIWNLKINIEEESLSLLSFAPRGLVGKYFARLWPLPIYLDLGQDAKKENKYVCWMSPRGKNHSNVRFSCKGISKNNVLPARYSNGIDTHCSDIMT